ncbi:choline ABC transporter permease, partial [Staphylococcus aureus]|nr:choline ABC transporter permease [Staphylococcus aureus]
MHHIVQFLQTNGGELLYKTYEHISIALIAVILAVVVGV